MIITIINQKGGVGKTTTTINLGYALALEGKKVLIIDLDFQANTSSIFYNPVSDDDKKVGSLFLSKSADIRRTIYPAYINEEEVTNLHIMPASKELEDIGLQIAIKFHRHKLLQSHLKKIYDDFDFILFDCHPDLGPVTENAIFLADMVLIPADYSKFALDGIAELFNKLEVVKEEGYQYRILKNKLDGRATATNALINEALDEFKDHLFNTAIRKSEAINQAQMYEEVIFTHAPRSTGAEDFKKLSKEILNHA